MDLKSMTPIAEYVDMLYTRAAIELSKIDDLIWRLELHPGKPGTGEIGTVRLVGYMFATVITQPCSMNVIEHGQEADAEAIAIVADYHIKSFIQAIEKARSPEEGCMMDVYTEDSPMIRWAEQELRRAGLFDEDSDYDGMLGVEVMRLIRAFCGQGHSGMSAHMTIDLFETLASWKPLMPLSDDPAEWMHIDEDMAGEPNLWQSRRNSSCFSNNGGKTFYDLDERQSRWRRVIIGVNAMVGRKVYTRWVKRHTTVEA